MQFTQKMARGYGGLLDRVLTSHLEKYQCFLVFTFKFSEISNFDFKNTFFSPFGDDLSKFSLTHSD